MAHRLHSVVFTASSISSSHRLHCVVSSSSVLCHGDSINEIRTQPLKASLVVSASKDESVRLWNVDTGICILIFSGVGGHRNEVLSVIYAGSFFAIPLARWFLLERTNSEIEKRNQAREKRARILEQATIRIASTVKAIVDERIGNGEVSNKQGDFLEILISANTLSDNEKLSFVDWFREMK
ncbi:hypothetical protein Syun_011121 [Stephania yunnanensis]|uniref:Uncharacterized protein n=1 Tax=Stephania yunnanensis TaxID=152371 RepID=A0AAP0JX70_9MAGN